MTKKSRMIKAAADTYAPIAMTGALEIEAAADDKKAPTFKMEAYNGGMLRLSGWGYPVVVDLAGMTIPSQTLPVRMQHDARQGVGHTTSVSKTKSKLSAAGVISRDTTFARDVVNSAAKGFPWQVSMGAAPNEVLFVSEKQKFKANSQTFDGPAYLVAKSTLGELSFVDLGADTSTSAAIAAEGKNNFNESETIMKRIKQLRLLAQGYTGRLTKEQLETAILAAAETEEDDQAFGARLEALCAEAKPVGDKPAPVKAAAATDGIDAAKAGEIAAAAVKAEQLRRRTIRVEGAGLGIDAAAIEAMIDDDAMTIEAARAKFLQEVRKLHTNKVPAAPAGIVVDKDVSGTQVIEAAAYMASGCGSEEKALKFFGEKVIEAASKIRSLGIQGLFILAAQAEGKHMPMISMGENDFIRAAFSITSLPGILSNLANKALLEGYLYGEEVWRKICKVGRVSDFKKHTRYRLGANMQYQKVGAGGEIKHGELTEQQFEMQADTYGTLIALTRQMIINDDLGAFAQLPFELGMGANDAINAAVWPLLESNPSSFFGAAHKNKPTAGAGNALAFESLSIAERTFLDQKKPNKQPLGVQPKTLLVPTALKATAEMLMKSTKVETTIGGLTENSTYRPTENIHAGKWEVACSAYLTNASKWWLFADPNRLAAIEVGFLNGIDRPTIESGQPNFDTLGIQMRAYLDFGVAMQDWRAAVEMATS